MSATRNGRFHASVYIGRRLESMLKTVSGCREARSQLKQMKEFWAEPPRDKVCILYGLRRTGKTTLLLQMAEALQREDAEQGTDNFAKTAYAICRHGMTVDDVYEDFMALEEAGMKTVLYDEATLPKGFIRGAAFLADSFARLGMRIFLAGTDSLKFLEASGGSLYDRCEILRTTHIPYREWSRITGIHGLDAVDQYADYGGTFVLSGGTGRKLVEPADIRRKKIKGYLDRSVIDNIANTLDDELDPSSSLENLKEINKAGELKDLINRVVQDSGHRFLLRVMESHFELQDFEEAKGKLSKIFDINGCDTSKIKSVISNIKDLLQFKDKENRVLEINNQHCVEARLLLADLDLFVVKTIWMYHQTISNWTYDYSENILAMPGMRCCMAQLLVDALMDDSRFGHIDQALRQKASKAIMEQVHGHMLEDIVAVEIADALQDEYFNLYEELSSAQIRVAGPDANQKCIDWLHVGCRQGERPIGEIDIVVFWKRPSPGCVLLEVKHGKKIELREQIKHLTNLDVINSIQNKFGEPIRKIILYNSQTSFNHNNCGVDYINVAEFLESLPVSLRAAMHPETLQLKNVLAKTAARKERLQLECDKKRIDVLRRREHSANRHIQHEQHVLCVEKPADSTSKASSLTREFQIDDGYKQSDSNIQDGEEEEYPKP